MATRTQAKAAIDNVVVSVKADIDLLPSTANIQWGQIRFNPNGWEIYLLEADLTAAITLKDAIVTALTAAARASTIAFKFAAIRETSVWPPANATVRTITVTSGNSKFIITMP